MTGPRMSARPCRASHRTDDAAAWVAAFENLIIIILTVLLVYLNILNWQANRRNARITMDNNETLHNILDVLRLRPG